MSDDQFQRIIKGTTTNRIVAEVSKSWESGREILDAAEDCIAARFEEVIRHNRDRGYRLESWQLVTAYVPPAGPGEPARPGRLHETVIAVFVGFD
jgi:hypothetical protein